MIRSMWMMYSFEFLEQIHRQVTGPVAISILCNSVYVERYVMNACDKSFKDLTPTDNLITMLDILV